MKVKKLPGFREENFNACAEKFAKLEVNKHRKVMQNIFELR